MAGRSEGPWAFPPEPRRFVSVAGKGGGEARISPLVARVAQGRSIPWATLERLGRKLDAPEA
eukprot:6474024-Alexandrium_andersonii.AAC.1